MSVSELGKIIKERRKILRVTQPHLAELAEISVNTLSKLERGENNPTINIITKIADIIGMELTLQIKKV
jgi:transcriptional regulator with XRE-family HTH domain